MQIKTFTIPIYDSGEMLDEMNKFLSINKVLEVVQYFCQSEKCWCFCVKYLPQLAPSNATMTTNKVDYKQVLGEKEFERFSILRKCRKQMAEEMALPPYVIFTDEELSGIAKLPSMELGKIKSVKGVGEKKYEKYGMRLFELYEIQKEENKENIENQ